MLQISKLTQAILVLIGVATCGLEASETDQEREMLCHYQEHEGTWKLLELPSKAVAKHIENHRDGRPGDAVPGSAGEAFDDDCSPVSIFTVIDFEEASSTVGDTILNGAGVFRLSNDIGVSVFLADTDEASDLGYSWTATAYDFATDCYYPIVQVRARAELNGEVYLMDFDGYSPWSTPAIDLDGPWTLIVPKLGVQVLS